MGILGKLFGNKPTIEKIQRALEQGSFAEALHLGEDLLAAGDKTNELSDSLIAASDGLARLNLDEGIRSQQAGNPQLADEHLQLALSQARSAELVKDVEDVLAQRVSESPALAIDQVQLETATGSACGSCAPPAREAEVPSGELLDLQSQIELIIASYPVDMRQRYLAQSDSFFKAFLLVHEGEDQQALPYWDEVPREERGELYLFELGCLHARLGNDAQGLTLLKQALDLDPGNPLIIDALLSLFLEKSDHSSAHELLQQQVDAGVQPAFCYARQCELHAAAQDSAAAFDFARKALNAGYAESGFFVLAAGLFEAAGQIEEAEQLLSGLSGGGCSGGINLPLAEFLLRQNRELAKILDAFNGACRQEPDNPRWQLRVAQTYLARKWRKQGLELLQRVVSDPRLDENLRLEAEQLLAKV